MHLEQLGGTKARPVRGLKVEVLGLLADARARTPELMRASYSPKYIRQRALMADAFRATESTHQHKMGSRWWVGMIGTVLEATKHHSLRRWLA